MNASLHSPASCVVAVIALSVESCLQFLLAFQQDIMLMLFQDVRGIRIQNYAAYVYCLSSPAVIYLITALMAYQMEFFVSLSHCRCQCPFVCLSILN